MIGLKEKFIKIKAHYKIIFHAIILTYLFLSFFIISIFCVWNSTKTIEIKKQFNTISFKQQNKSVSGYNSKTTIFFKDQTQMLIQSDKANIYNNSFNLLEDCKITTPYIRAKIYQGPTKIIEINDKKNTFNIPNKMTLTNHNNNQNNYIITNEIHGSFSNVIESSLPFKINDDDLFLSGDNLYIRQQDRYMKITKNSHLIYTKTENTDNKKIQPEIYDIKSEQMEAFGNTNIAIFYKNVNFANKDAIAKSQFAKVYFNENKNPTDIFLSKNVNIHQNNNHSTSDFGFFDIEKNLIILYKNVSIHSDKNESQGEFYIYNTDDKTTIAFNEYTILKRGERKMIYEILEKLSQELNVFDRKYILNVIKNNKQNIKNKLNKTSENYNIDRTKRTRMDVFN